VRSLVERATAIWRKEFPEDHWQIANTRSWLGVCLLNRGRYGEAEPILLTSYEQLGRQRGEHDEVTRRVRGFLVKLYEGWGKPEEAARFRANEAPDTGLAKTGTG
jgi:hypothetical protein